MATRVPDNSYTQAHFHVFLSFRGPDTRQGFTNCLYHCMLDAGINVFMDDKDQPLGLEIDKLLDAIRNSDICIPIFSRGYASSKWCLRELAHMVELKKEIIPIFYDVTPNDVKLRTNLYVKAMKHASPELRTFGCFPKEKVSEVRQWENALRHVCTLSGRELKDTGYQEFCKSITTQVSNKLNIKHRPVSVHLVGMDDKVEAASKFLDFEAQDVRYLGIHGMSGIGKTTLAKVVFNRLSSDFEFCSFLSDVQESWQRRGVEKLQETLLHDLQYKIQQVADSDDGITKIITALYDKKVLIVLDDVNSSEQISKLAGNPSWFARGSRIIMTTRDRSVITGQRELAEEAILMYLEMEGLNPGQALQLFSRHVFGSDDPPPELLDLSRAVVSLCGNLPLLLEIKGSQLYRNKCKEEWEDIIMDLKKIPHHDIRQKLMTTYEALDHRTKQIFLDIACFFVNKEKTNPLYMWEACGFHPHRGVQDLVDKSLVKIGDDDGKIWMHNHLRDLGRELVLQENMDAGERSRLWRHEEALGILNRKEGTSKIEALRLSKDHQLRDRCFGREEFRPLRKLRFLELYGSNLGGDFQNLLNNLRWLSWRDCPINFEAANLNLENLVILDLSRSDISENWIGWSRIKMGCNLKVIDLRRCENLTKTPDFSKFTALQRLILEGCKKLLDINSIGKVKSLKHLNVKECDQLQGLPEALCHLYALEDILVKGNGGSFTLPQKTGSLKSLVLLEIVGVAIAELPPSVCELKRLQHLDLSYCSGVKKLPGSFGKLASLVKLDISHSTISELPDSIGKLKDLRVLNLEASSITRLPATIRTLMNLEELCVKNNKLATLPRGMEDLCRLKILDLSLTRIRELPQVGNLSSLQELHLEECDKLRQLPNLPSSLAIISVKSSSLWTLPDLSNLGNLEKMVLDILHRTGGSSNSNVLQIDLSASSHLEVLILKMHCRPQLPSSLVTLALGYIDTSNSFLSLDHLRNLSSLELSKCSLEGGFKGLKLVALGSLRNLSIRNCQLEQLSGRWLPLNLDTLVIKDCEILIILRRLGRMENLRRLHLSNCEDLVEVQGLGKLKSLRWLVINGCHSLRGLENLSMLENLQHISVNDCTRFVDIQGLGGVEHLKNLLRTRRSSRWTNYMPPPIIDMPDGLQEDIWHDNDDNLQDARQYDDNYSAFCSLM